MPWVAPIEHPDYPASKDNPGRPDPDLDDPHYEDILEDNADELSPVALILHKILESNLRLEQALIATLENSMIIRSNQEKAANLKEGSHLSNEE